MKNNIFGKGKVKNNEELGFLNINSSLYKTRLNRKFINRKPFKKADPGMVTAFIPGTILDILVEEGQGVEKGDYLFILDAMKMQNKLVSPARGKVKKINVRKGDRVSRGNILLELNLF